MSNNSSNSAASRSNNKSPPLTGTHIKAAVSEFEVATSSSCPECGEEELIEDRHRGQLVCTACGLQIGGSLISDDVEWRDFGEDDGPASHGVLQSRVGGPEGGLIDMGLSTTMAQSDSGAGNLLSRLQSKSTSNVDASVLLEAMRQSSRLASAMTLPPLIVERTNQLYKRVIESGVFKAKKMDVALVACLYIACRHEGVPRTLKEICQSAVGSSSRKGAAITVQEVAKAYKKIKISRAYASNTPASALVNTSSLSMSHASSATASSLVPRFCSQLKLPLSVERVTISILEAASKEGCLEGRAPSTIAAASILMASQLAALHDASLQRAVEPVARISLTAVATISRALKELTAGLQQHQTAFQEEFRKATTRSASA